MDVKYFEFWSPRSARLRSHMICYLFSTWTVTKNVIEGGNNNFSSSLLIIRPVL